ncbi:hypothetical protein [Achromobacter spanius]|uniref:Uncharacterized protein n=1 Tax=Achromobacter spanius TaxID=217203 RepID=A0A2S0I2U9_9BURK|nr:hypothetical protein [Achromobacter spanius]AVJ26351.1 hypothetical protein CLM73_04070 [Achromobacter spanius]
MASTAARGEADSPRILAALEGRAPEAEVKHMATPRSSRARRWTALALVLLLLAGGIVWVIHEDDAASMMAQAPAPVSAPVPAPATPLQQAAASPTPASGGNPLGALEKTPDVATIIDEAPPARDADVGRGEPEPLGEPANPLSVLAMTPSSSPATTSSLAAAPAPGPTRQAAERLAQRDDASGADASGAAASGAGASGAAAPRTVKSAPAAPRKSAKTGDKDAALLSALMDYGLPPASPPGTRVYKSDGVFIREMPGSPLSERLKECRRLSFIAGEQCRLRVCAGQWGTAPECPTPQANIEP